MVDRSWIRLRDCKRLRLDSLLGLAMLAGTCAGLAACRASPASQPVDSPNCLYGTEAETRACDSLDDDPQRCITESGIYDFDLQRCIR